MITRRRGPYRAASGIALVLSFIAMTSACIAAPQAPPEPIQADFVLAIAREGNVPPGRIFLKPIPGGLLGKAADVEIFRSRTGTKTIAIPLAALSARLDDYAARARSDAINPGELTRPRDARIARVATFYEPVSRNTVCNNFRTGLRTQYPASAMLVYVDRPATVQGMRYSEPYVMNYDLEFPKAGLYAVETHSLGIVVTQRVVDVDGQLTANVRRVPCG